MENLFPPVLQCALKALAHETRQLIVSYIIKNGRARPRDLQKALGLKSNEVAYHLKELVKGNILRRRICNESEAEDEIKLVVVYELTPLGEKLIHNLFLSIAPSGVINREG